jgi:DNA polymerase
VETRNRPVYGIGNYNAKIMIVGLAPGKDGADLTGIPFTRDPSGELFDEMLSAAGLSRGQDVFITNLVKCNPKDTLNHNRTPSKEEIENCSSYLKCEIDYLKPHIVVTLGKHPTETLLNVRIHNMAHHHGKRILSNGILAFPFIHPGYVIRGAYNRKRYLEEFKVVGDIFRDLIKQESRLSRLDILLILLDSSTYFGSKGLIRDKTRLQKMLFLMQQELVRRGYKAKYAFRPYLFGPYSRELYTDIEWLRMNGLVEVKTDFSGKAGTITDYIITKDGKNRLTGIAKSQMFKQIDGIAKDMIKKYERMSTAQLVEYVHEQFTGYKLDRPEKKIRHRNMQLDSFMGEESRSSIERTIKPKKEI